MSLNNKQKAFIKSKVKELGSMEAVERFYRKDCLVTEYARKYDRKMFKVK